MENKVSNLELFTDKDMTSFGNYLLSDERRMRIINNPQFPDSTVGERLQQVSHADFLNWHESNKQNNGLN